MVFTELEIKIAALLRSGKNNSEVAEIIGKTVRTVQRLKSKPGFRELIGEQDNHKIDISVNNAVNKAVEKAKPDLIKQVISEIVEDELELTKQKLSELYLETVRELVFMGETLRLKLKGHIDNIDEISPRLFGQYAKAYQDMLLAPLNISKLFLVDEEDNIVRIEVNWDDDTPPEGFPALMENSEDS